MHNMSVNNIRQIIIRWECENVYPVEGQAEACKESASRLPSSLSSTYSSSSTSYHAYPHQNIESVTKCYKYLAIHPEKKKKIQRMTSFSDFVGLKRAFPAVFISKKVIRSIASISGSGVLFVPASASLVENTDRLMSASYWSWSPILHHANHFP